MRNAIVYFYILFIFASPSSILAVNYGDGNYGLGLYNEGEPTPTPSPITSPVPSPIASPFPSPSSVTPTNSNTSTSNTSGSNSSSAAAESCNDPVPSTPQLFQIDIQSTSAKLFFTPLQSTNTFYISYSTSTHAEEHGAQIHLAREGVQNFTINLLKPNTIYYFKVRGQNGCMPGQWSNIMESKSTASGFTKYISYYLNSVKAKVVNVFSSTKQSIAKNPTASASISAILTEQSPIPVSPVQVDEIVTSQVSPIPVLKAVPTQSKRKFCFLWWCW